MAASRTEEASMMNGVPYGAWQYTVQEWRTSLRTEQHNSLGNEPKVRCFPSTSLSLTRVIKWSLVKLLQPFILRLSQCQSTDTLYGLSRDWRSQRSNHDLPVNGRPSPPPEPQQPFLMYNNPSSQRTPGLSGGSREASDTPTSRDMVTAEKRRKILIRQELQCTDSRPIRLQA
ncbi:unnamed protein product [Pleuronectes platessa]|uniref:Uncharacterized protein n=1 Tax=Pleuronectes platessa TaxID=8262 RepID=A0A9N7TJN8_PLEPL|nr:unnamed protein product [Pleuronectes platessa]